MTPDLTSHDPAVQLATLSRSADRVSRARAYTDRLAAHHAEVQARLAERQVSGTTDAGPLRGELIEVERQHAQAMAILADVEAEHARHEADLAAMMGSDGEARAKLKQAQEARAAAKGAADEAKAILDRASAHAETVGAKLASALDEERRHDEAAADRLRTALMEGGTPEPAAEALVRSSAALEDDLRVARATAERLKAEHDARLAALAKADLAVRAAVDGVLLIEAEAVARELTATRARAALLHSRLLAYADRRPGDYVPPSPVQGPVRQMPGGWFVRDAPPMASTSTIRQTPEIVAALTADLHPVVPTNAPRIDPSQAGSWAAYASSLVADAEARPRFVEVPASGSRSSLSTAPLSSTSPLPSDPELAAINRLARDARPAPRASQGRAIA